MQVVLYEDENIKLLKKNNTYDVLNSIKELQNKHNTRVAAHKKDLEMSSEMIMQTVNRLIKLTNDISERYSSK